MDKADNIQAQEPQAEAIDPSPRQRLLSEIGQKLVQSRQARGEELSIVVHKLKLRGSHLQALENGDWDTLPDDVYALGFLRQYSTYLSLDLKDEIQRIKHNEYILTRPLTFPDPPVAPSRRWAWIAGATFILLFIAFNILNQDTIRDLLITPKAVPMKAEQATASSEQSIIADNSETADRPSSEKTEETEPEQESESISVASVPESASETASSIIDDSPAEPEAPAETTSTAAANSAHVATEPAAPADNVSAAANNQTATAPPTPSPVEDSTSALANADKPPVIIDLYAKPDSPAESEETAATEPVKPASIHAFRFEAVTASVWLQIYLPDESGQAKGRLYKEVLLQKGYHASLKKAVDSVWITCGNPSAMRIKVDSQVQADLGSLGAVGKVLRDYQFKVAQ